MTTEVASVSPSASPSTSALSLASTTIALNYTSSLFLIASAVPTIIPSPSWTSRPSLHQPRVTPHPDGVIRGLVQGHRSCWAVAIQCVVMILLWASAVFGNVLVCLVIHRSRRFQSTTNYFVKSMAYSDLILVLVTSPLICTRLIRDEWDMGHIVCRFVRFTQLASMASIAFILMAVCFDRYYTIIYPLRFKVTRGTAKRLIIVSWIAAAVMSSLSIYIFEELKIGYSSTDNNSKHNNNNNRVILGSNPDEQSFHHICPTFIPASHWTGQIYSCALVFVHFLCPVVAIAFGYSRVMHYIDKTKFKVQIRRTSTVIPRNKVKMVKTLLILTTITLLFYSPFFIIQLYYCFNHRLFMSPDVFVAAYSLISLSAVIKPIIYACRNSNFWRGCKEILCMSGLSCYRLNSYTITTVSRLGKKNFIGIMDLSREQHTSMATPTDNIRYHYRHNHKPSSVRATRRHGEMACRVEDKRNNNSQWSPNGAAPCTSF